MLLDAKQDSDDQSSPQSSPILRRVATAKYLDRFAQKKPLKRPWKDMGAFLRAATVNAQLIREPLGEEDFRIISFMDAEKRWRVANLAHREQSQLISIVMPTKDRAGLISTAIQSILAQSYKNFELIIVDDGGQDRTESVVLRFQDDRIRYIRSHACRGNAAARNEGLAAAKGGYIAYLDDDDMWDPDFLLISANELIDSKSEFCYSAQLVWRGYDEEAGLGKAVRMVRFAPFNRSLLENTNYISMISCMHSRALMDRAGVFDESLSRLVDWDFFLRATECTAPIAIPCILSHYFYARSLINVTGAVDPQTAAGAIDARLVKRSCWSGSFSFESGQLVNVTGVGSKSRALREPISKGASKRTKIIIPNYEAREEIGACLRFLPLMTDTDYQVVVVDNGSSYDTKRTLRRIAGESERVSVIDYDDHLGFSFAVNAGISLIDDRDDFVVILNNDTIVTPGWLDEMAIVFSQHSDCGMAVPRQVLPPEHPISRNHVPMAVASREVDINLSAHHQNIHDPLFDPSNGIIELNYAPLFCTMMRAADIRALGKLDSASGPHYRSDWILCDAVRRRLKKRILYTPHSKVYHLQGVSTSSAKAATR